MIYIVGLLAVIFLALAALVVSRMASVVRGVSGSETNDDATYTGISNRINGAMFIVFLVLGTTAAVWSFIH